MAIESGSTIYISGSITNDPDYREKFRVKAQELESKGYKVMNPAVLPDGFDYEHYICIGFAMLDGCQIIYMMACWRESPGAKRELERAREKGLKIIYEGQI